MNNEFDEMKEAKQTLREIKEEMTEYRRQMKIDKEEYCKI